MCQFFFPHSVCVFFSFFFFTYRVLFFIFSFYVSIYLFILVLMKISPSKRKFPFPIFFLFELFFISLLIKISPGQLKFPPNFVRAFGHFLHPWLKLIKATGLAFFQTLNILLHLRMKLNCQHFNLAFRIMCSN